MINLDRIEKTFHSTSGGDVHAVLPTTLEILRGEIFGIIGRSGAGKSTLLRLINRLEEPTAGHVYVDGLEITALRSAALRNARRAIGMIFQSFNLLQNRTVLGNATFPLEIAGVTRREARARARECLALVGLEDKTDNYPAQLSGGQKQRVAIARALAPRPKVLLCDEPTSALDPLTADSILRILRDVNHQFGVTIVVVTHSMDVVRMLCQRVAVMEHGRVVKQLRVASRGPEVRAELASLLRQDEDLPLAEPADA
jgi:D-methionine transport system ATP-binding protein